VGTGGLRNGKVVMAVYQYSDIEAAALDAIRQWSRGGMREPGKDYIEFIVYPISLDLKDKAFVFRTSADLKDKAFVLGMTCEMIEQWLRSGIVGHLCDQLKDAGHTVISSHKPILISTMEG
jgi:hypothetical protein